MSAAVQLAKYQFQAQHVADALALDPDNSELLNLQSDVNNLVELYQKQVEEEGDVVPKETSTSVRPKQHLNQKYKIGDIVLAKFSDGNYYEATIAGDPTGETVEVIYTGYETVEVVPLQDLKPCVTVTQQDGSHAVASTESVLVGDVTETKKPKRKFTGKKEQKISKTDRDNAVIQNRWKTFTQGKAMKKAKPVVASSTKSIFDRPVERTIVNVESNKTRPKFTKE